jgi:hypothetical protein
MRAVIGMAGLLLQIGSVAAPGQVKLYVAPGGQDDNAGTEAAPLASLAGARDRVRAVKADHAGETVVVEFAAGTYSMSGPVDFGAGDSGAADAPIVYRAARGADVRLTGGRAVGGWQPVEDPAVTARLPAEARGQVLGADLPAQGIEDFGRLAVRGFGEPSPPAEAELFWDDEPLRLARWPNDGFRGVEAVDGVVRVTVDTDRIARWVDEPDPWVFAYWHHDWADLHEPIAGLLPEDRVLHRSESITPRYGVTPGQARWYAYNLLAELDQPGEYYLDRTAGKLYAWPPLPDGRAVLSQAEALIRARDLAHVTFQGFTLEACRGTAISLDGGASCTIAACTIRNVGHQAVWVNGGDRHTVYGCDISHCGEGGITMAGGDRRSLTPAGHNAENNHVHHYSRRVRTYKTGITVSGVGNRIAHNLIHDGPHMALSAPGNDHVVEYNEIHHVVHESGDAGAYYVGRDWTQRGNVLRYNYWHDIAGSSSYGGMTIYLDDQHSGHTIHGNLFERCSQAVFIGGGDDNLVTNNVFRNCRRAAHIDNRGMGWQKAATDDPNGTLRSRLRDMPIGEEPWKSRYPNLARIHEDEPNIPKRNVFARNISAGGNWDHLDASTLPYQTIEQNLVFDDDPDWITIETDESGRPTRLTFRDPERVRDIGFQPIPLEKIGPYPDAQRASWPIPRSTRMITLPP